MKNTAKQIENMKKQTIGVEIEMAGITRKAAIKVIAKYFNTEDTIEYLGGGYDRYTCKDNQGRTWQIMKDVSIQDTFSKQTEMVTPILHYEDIETLQELVRALRKRGAISNPEHGCGVHIHIGADGHDAKTLRNLVNIMAAHEEQLTQAVRIDRWRQSRYCRTVDPAFLERLNRSKPKTMEALSRCWYNGERDTSHYSGTRYRMLNLHSFFNRYHTIEFRLFQFDEPGNGRQGGLHAGQLKSMLQLCLAMSELAKELRYASPKKQQDENVAYALRCWMLRLGFIGDEFKTAREYFMRNAEGNCAWRHGRP